MLFFYKAGCEHPNTSLKLSLVIFTSFMKRISAKTGSAIATCVLLFGILMLWIYKFPFLHLPFFWDEGWSYAQAIWTMYKNHPCLVPGCLPADLYRGHPLWFYFMNAVVAQIFGFTPLVMHIFALVVSSIFLVVFFYILKRFTNPVFALLGTLLLLSQEIFIVQSSFMFPEILIAMMTIIAVFSLFTGKNFLYFLSASILALTKETGIVIISVLAITAFIILINQQIHDKNKTFSSLVKHFFLVCSPLLIGIAFYAYQKMIYGWYFYPLHIQLMDFSQATVIDRMVLIREIVFTGYGKKILAVMLGFMIILLLIYHRRSKISFPAELLKITWSLLAVFTFYFIFSAINFLLLRYLIPLVVIFIFLLTAWSYQIHQLGFRLFPWLFGLAIGISLHRDFTSDPSWIDDVSMNYTDDVVVHQQAVDFMEYIHAHSKKIFTFYLMQYNLTHPELFYLHGPPFENVDIDVLKKNEDYYIFSNLVFNESDYNYVKSNDSLQLIKRFESGKAWSEIYARK